MNRLGTPPAAAGEQAREQLARPVDPQLYDEIRELWKRHSIAEENRDLPGLIATLLRVEGKPVLLAELRGDQMGLFKKFVSPGTTVEPVDLGEFGVWIHGGSHVLIWDGRRVETRLAGDVLLWLSQGTTYRLEGRLDKGQMLALAHQITR